MSPKLRRQILFIIRDNFGQFDSYDDQQYFEIFVDALRREHGVTQLTQRLFDLPGEELEHYIETSSDEEALDAIEFIFRFIRRRAREGYGETQVEAKAAIEEFNIRCRRAGYGYEFSGSALVRIDSQVLHAEAVRPALVLLSDLAFASANAEFRSAHEHWRNGNLSEVLVDCLKAFESTIKIIATESGWALPDRPTASQLVQMIYDNGLIPDYYLTHFSGIRSTLESGIATPRNRVGGHGAGAASVTQPDRQLVQYVMNLTASTILFLVERHRAPSV